MTYRWLKSSTPTMILATPYQLCLLRLSIYRPILRGIFSARAFHPLFATAPLFVFLFFLTGLKSLSLSWSSSTSLPLLSASPIPSKSPWRLAPGARRGVPAELLASHQLATSIEPHTRISLIEFANVELESWCWWRVRNFSFAFDPTVAASWIVGTMLAGYQLATFAK